MSAARDGWQREARSPQMDAFERMWREENPDVPPPQPWVKRDLRALVGREPYPDGSIRWHISVAGQGRVPTWDEMAACAHALRPGVPLVMGVPPRSQWMNVHPHTLHMWESQDAALIESWRENAMGHEPT